MEGEDSSDLAEGRVVNRADWQHLAEVRIAEAEALLALVPPRPDGAYYLAGYAVECGLKACIARAYNQYDWPEKQFVSDCHTHNLLNLVRLAGLEAAKNAARAANPALAVNWSIVKDWNEQSRYQTHALIKAQRMIEAVSHAADGVLPWIKGHW
jgi:hypothetical protein